MSNPIKKSEKPVVASSSFDAVSLRRYIRETGDLMAALERNRLKPHMRIKDNLERKYAKARKLRDFHTMSRIDVELVNLHRYALKDINNRLADLARRLAHYKGLLFNIS